MAQLPPWPSVPYPSAGTTTPSLEAPSQPRRRPGILVVDDEPLMRELLQVGLEHDGFRVWQAADGWQALVLYEHLGPAVAIVLLDVRMPGLDGPQTLSALQRLNPDVCCCFISGHTGRYQTAELLDRGAALVIAKPFRLAEVAKALWQLASDGAAAHTRPPGRLASTD